MKKRTRYEPNEITDCGDYCEIFLYSSLGDLVGKTKIDKEDLEKVKKYKWHLSSREYARCSNKGSGVILHRLIMNTPNGFSTDHINHDKLDNRKQNLRVCTQQQNCFNKKLANGYSWNKRIGKWHARVMLNRKTIHLGYFNNKKLAIEARRCAEIKYFGEFSYRF